MLCIILNFNLLNLFSFPLLEALQASLSGLILHAGQTAGKGRKGKENGQGFNGIPNPTGTARRGLKGHLRFAEGCRKIHEPVSGAVLDARTTAVPLHGKISPAGIAGRMAGEWGYKGNSRTECKGAGQRTEKRNPPQRTEVCVWGKCN